MRTSLAVWFLILSAASANAANDALNESTCLPELRRKSCYAWLDFARRENISAAQLRNDMHKTLANEKLIEANRARECKTSTSVECRNRLKSPPSSICERDMDKAQCNAWIAFWPQLKVLVHKSYDGTGIMTNSAEEEKKHQENQRAESEASLKKLTQLIRFPLQDHFRGVYKEYGFPVEFKNAEEFLQHHEYFFSYDTRMSILNDSYSCRWNMGDGETPDTTDCDYITVQSFVEGGGGSIPLAITRGKDGRYHITDTPYQQ